MNIHSLTATTCTFVELSASVILCRNVKLSSRFVSVSTALSPVCSQRRGGLAKAGGHYRLLEPQTVNSTRKVIRSYTPACAKPLVGCQCICLFFVYPLFSFQFRYKSNRMLFLFGNCFQSNSPCQINTYQMFVFECRVSIQTDKTWSINYS